MIRWSPRARELLSALAPVAASAFLAFVVFKLLSFFLAPANLVLCSLLIGHPIGVVLGSAVYAGDPLRARRHHLIVCLATIALLPLLQIAHPSLLNVGLPGFSQQREMLWGILRFLVAAGLAFLPSFAFAGVVELHWLDAARRAAWRPSWAWGALLAIALLSLGASYALIGVIGTTGILAIVIALCVLGVFPERRTRLVTIGAAAAFLVATTASPRIESAWVAAVAPRSKGSLNEELARGAKILHGAWGRHAYTQLVGFEHGIIGAYDSHPYWSVEWTIEKAQIDGPSAIDSLPIRLAPRGGRMAIMGSGGGRQVQQALRLSRDLEIDAFEIDEVVVGYFRAHPETNGRAYVQPGVRLIGGEGRRNLEAETKPYDLIYLPDTGSALTQVRSLLLSPHFVHTADAYKGFARHLAPHGVLAVKFSRRNDHGRNISQRAMNIFASMGLSTFTAIGTEGVVIMAAARDDAPALFARAEQEMHRYGQVEVRRDMVDLSLPNAVPTDNHGGTVVYAMFPPDMMRRAFIASLAAGLIVLPLLIRWLRRRSAEVGAARPLPFWPLVLAAVTGVEFVLLENAVVLQASRVLFDITDATIVGSVAFLLPATLGASIAHRFTRHRGLAVVVVIGLAAFAAYSIERGASLGWLILAEGALVFGAGAFFPILLELTDPREAFALFACDGAGAYLGSVAVLFVPMLYGIDRLAVVAVSVCALTGALVILSARSGPKHQDPAATGAPE